MIRKSRNDDHLFLKTNKKEITILQDVSISNYKSSTILTQSEGDIIIDFQILDFNRILTLTFDGYLTLFEFFPSYYSSSDTSFLTNSGKNSNESTRDKSLPSSGGYFKKLNQLNLKLKKDENTKESGFSLAVCSKNQYVVVCSCNQADDSRLYKLYMLKISPIHESSQFNILSVLDFQGSFLAEKSESYFYDIRMDFYFGNWPLIVGVQQDFEHKFISFLFIEEGIGDFYGKIKKKEDDRILEKSEGPIFVEIESGFSLHVDEVFRLDYVEEEGGKWVSFDNSGVLNFIQIDKEVLKGRFNEGFE